MHRAPGIAGLALVLAGCTAPGESLHGVAAATVRAAGEEGRRAAGGGLSLDLLQERWIGSFRSDTQVLDGDLEVEGARRTSVQTWELAAGPKVFESPALRLDAFAGARARTLRAADSLLALPSRDEERETWYAPIAGVRAEFDLGGPLSLRVRGDASHGIPGGERAWRASAAGIWDVSRVVSLSIGWETSSIHRERGRGGDRFLFDATLAGPFLALELRF